MGPKTRLTRQAVEVVVLLAYGARTVDAWWQQSSGNLKRFGNLDIFRLSAEEGLALAALAERKMKLSCTIQEGAIYMEGVELHPQVLQASGI